MLSCFRDLHDLHCFSWILDDTRSAVLQNIVRSLLGTETFQTVAQAQVADGFNFACRGTCHKTASRNRRAGPGSWQRFVKRHLGAAFRALSGSAWLCMARPAEMAPCLSWCLRGNFAVVVLSRPTASPVIPVCSTLPLQGLLPSFDGLPDVLHANIGIPCCCQGFFVVRLLGA